jgi:probable addiction module antidote protein
MPESRALDAAKHHDDPRASAKYLNEALSTDDPVLIRKAIGDMARAQGTAKFSRKVGMSRENLSIEGLMGKRVLHSIRSSKYCSRLIYECA